VVVVECSFATDKVFYFVDPRGVIDEFLKRFAGLVDLLEVKSVCGAVVDVVDVAMPLSGFMAGGLVETGIELVNFIGGECAFQKQISAQVKEVDITLAGVIHNKSRVSSREFDFNNGRWVVIESLS